MFGRKKDSEKAVSQSPFPLEILTTEYFIEGTATATSSSSFPSAPNIGIRSS